VTAAEHAARIPKWKGDKDGMMVINMEWGGFGSHSAFPQVSPSDAGVTPWYGMACPPRTTRAQLPFHDVDNQLDALSPNEGAQRWVGIVQSPARSRVPRLPHHSSFHPSHTHPCACRCYGRQV